MSGRFRNKKRRDERVEQAQERAKARRLMSPAERTAHDKQASERYLQEHQASAAEVGSL